MATTGKRKLITGVLAAACCAFAADAPSQFRYCENVVKPVNFDAQGSWVLTGIAAYSEVLSLDRPPRRRLIGSRITVSGEQVRLLNKKATPWKVPFPTPVLGQETYDTHSKEFWLDFQTDPQDLNLPRYVSAVNVELGTILRAGPGRVFLDYSGVWFSLARAGGSSGQAP